MKPDRKRLPYLARAMTLGALLAACGMPDQPSAPQVARRPAASLQRTALAAPPVKLALLPAPSPMMPPAQSAGLQVPETAQAEPVAADPFAATTWAPPPPPAPPPAPAAVAAQPAPPVQQAPVAPPNPFVYVGSYQDGPQKMVVLLKGDQVLLVQQGETIDNAYRLERIGPAGLVMTYLPLQPSVEANLPRPLHIFSRVSNALLAVQKWQA